jgi:hypothetical protein
MMKKTPGSVMKKTPGSVSKCGCALLVLKKFTHVSFWHCPHRIFKADEEEAMMLVAVRGEVDVRSV